MASCVQSHTGCSWLAHCHARGDHCLGIVYVPVRFLTSRRELARELDPTILSNLVAILQKELDHDSCNNAIEGYVEYTEIGTIVEKLNTSIETLHQTLYDGRRPTLEHPISFLDGQHRVEAAKIAFGEKAIWTVRLLSRPGTKLSAFIQSRATCQRLDKLSHQTRYSDGEVFRQITQLWKTSKFEQVREWTARLGAQKRVNIDMIKDNHQVFSCLDGLSHFPGLLSDLPLGSFHKHLALHCDDEIVNYLKHIRDVWLGLTCNHPDVVDIGTVQLLEGRAPGISDIDRQLVEDAFDSYEIFSKAQNPQLRVQIRSSVLHFKGLVPSLKSYQENMKFMSIGVTVVDDLLFPDSGRTKSWKRQQTDRRTFRGMLRQHWSPPRQNLVEVREGVMARCVGEPVFDVAYKQVILAAMRNFPRLSDQFTPRKDSTYSKLSLGTDPELISVFYSRASMLGFDVPSYKMPQRRPCIPVACDVETGGEMPLNQRWGVPYVGVLRAIRNIMFLPQLSEAQPLGASVTFVQKDFIYSFLGACRPYRLSDDTFTLDVRSVQFGASECEVQMEQYEHVDSPQRPTVCADTLPVSGAAASLSVNRGNTPEIRVQNLAARHQVEQTRPDSIMSLTALVQDPVGEWLEASLARTPSVESGFEISYPSQTSSQSRSGIDTPLHSWSGRESINDTHFNMTTIEQRFPTSSAYVVSPPSWCSRSAIESIGFDSPSGHIQPQCINSTQEPAISAINLGLVMHSPVTSVPSLVRSSATQAPTGRSLPFRPANPLSLENNGIHEDTVSSGSSTIQSRSEIGPRDFFQQEQSWFHRLPPLKSYLPSLQWTFESRSQSKSGLNSRFDDGMSLCSIPLSPASEQSRSEIGTPLMTQHARTYVRQEVPRCEPVHQTHYWDVV